MHHHRLLTFVAFLLVLPTAVAQDEHAGHHPQATAVGQERAADGSADLDAGMKRVEALMMEIRSTGDAAQRSRLLDEHLAALRDQIKLVRSQPRMKMGMMNRADAPAAAGDDPHAGHGGGSADGQGSGMMGGRGGMMGMHKKMEGRVDMLERLIEQLIEREAEGALHAHH